MTMKSICHFEILMKNGRVECKKNAIISQVYYYDLCLHFYVIVYFFGFMVFLILTLV